MSIIKLAAELPPSTTLVMGSSGSGKSSTVRDEIIKSNWKALWVAFNNTAALTAGAPDSVASWAVAVPSSWAEFNDEILSPVIKGEFKEYNTVVWDGLNVASALALNKVVKADKQPTQADWGDASELIRDAVVRLRSHFVRVFITVDVVSDGGGGRKTALNPYLHTLIVTLCGERWYTYVQPIRSKESGEVTGLKYDVQRNSALALNFTPNPTK